MQWQVVSPWLMCVLLMSEAAKDGTLATGATTPTATSYTTRHDA